MKPQFFLVVIISLLLASCSEGDIVKTFYPNGNIKHEMYIVNGIANGIDKFYYSNGSIKKEQTWQDGLINGEIVQYYANGKVKRRSFAKKSVEIGLTLYYDSTGLITSKEMNDSLGRLIFMQNMQNMKLSSKQYFPIFNDQYDTVPAGSPYKTSVCFGINVDSSTKMILGKMSPSYDIYDTLAVVDYRGKKFEIQLIPFRLGRNSVSYKFVDSRKPRDSTSVNNISGNHVFYSK